MWITLLNLSGESPLWNYSIGGKIVTSLVGIFATGWFGIPIGLLAAGFENWIDDEVKEERFEEAASSIIRILTNRRCLRCYIKNYFWEELNSVDQLKYLRYLHLNLSMKRSSLTSKGWKAREGRLQLVRYESGQRLRFEYDATFQNLDDDRKMSYLIHCAQRVVRFVCHIDDEDTVKLYCKSALCNVKTWSETLTKIHKNTGKRKRPDFSILDNDDELEKAPSKEMDYMRSVVVKFGQKILICDINERRDSTSRRDTPLLNDVDQKDVLSSVAGMEGYESNELLVSNGEGEIESDFDVIVVRASTTRLRIHTFIEENVRFQIFITTIIIITVIESILSSVDSINDNDTASVIFNNIIEPVAVVIFTLEFVFRLYAVPDDPSYRWIRQSSCCTYLCVIRLCHCIFLLFLKFFSFFSHTIRLSCFIRYRSLELQHLMQNITFILILRCN